MNDLGESYYRDCPDREWWELGVIAGFLDVRYDVVRMWDHVGGTLPADRTAASIRKWAIETGRVEAGTLVPIRAVLPRTRPRP